VIVNLIAFAVAAGLKTVGCFAFWVWLNLCVRYFFNVEDQLIT
jgi:drug/metabolite transporter superfamily protein YnfA